ncbi:STAS domain-containing protein [Actinoplanes sp. NPDC051861]|uniref:STAS domain-containing protein n=1 Tax=Actinoplanes sp. NPDC051861 TaxID=3155170 RepID=UPI00341E0B8A
MTDNQIWAYRIDDHDGTPTVALTGELDLAAADELRAILTAQLDRPATTGVTADLSGVTFMDSAALGALIAAFQHAAATNHTFVITDAPRGVRRIMEIAGIYDILTGEAPHLGE